MSWINHRGYRLFCVPEGMCQVSKHTHCRILGGLRSALLLRMLASDSMSDVEMWRRYFDAVLLIADDQSYLPSVVVCSLYTLHALALIGTDE